MSRLTYLDNNRPAFKFNDTVYKIEVSNKLYEYENTGLTPEEIKDLQVENKKLKLFKKYFDDLWGIGLEIANWHLNGEVESFDNFYESAIEYMER